MNNAIDQSTVSLGADPARPAGGALPPATPRSLLDLMSDGFYMLLLLKRGQMPAEEAPFIEAIRRFLETVERQALKLGLASEDIYLAKYAYCAAIDEAVLTQMSPLRDSWERRPLQLRLFGDHLAGENFFIRLEDMRAKGALRLQALEVYYLILLLGFEGKYRIEGSEKLGYLTARLGDEIAFLKGKRAPFAPHWPPPDTVAHTLRRVVPLWAPAAAVAVIALIGFAVLSWSLGRHTDERLAAYQDVVQLPPRTATLTITLP